MPPALQRTDLLDDHSLRGRAFCTAWTDRVEEWLTEVFAGSAGDRGDLALVALGGQGRREMAPHSDLDLLLLFRGESPAEVAEQLWYPVWDAGLKLGHSVRTVRDTLALASEDLETATSLLSARHICGDEDLSIELAERAWTNWRKKGRRWQEELAVATDERHAAAGEVAHALEPDLKEGRGGLRDVHALLWAAAAGAPTGGHITDDLQEHHDVLLEVRVELHRQQGRPGDRLLLQEQDAIAKNLGDRDADALMARVATAGSAIAEASDEAWYDTEFALGGSFLSRFRRSRSLDGGLVITDGRVALADPAQARSDPFAALRVATAAAREQLRMSEDTLAALSAAPEPPEPWSREGREAFCDLLLTGPSAVPLVETLTRAGVWTKLLPEWEPNICRPQRNAFHRFTVDRHLLEAAAEAAGLAHLVPRPDLLVVAALLHDIGKGYPELGDHSEQGGTMAAHMARRMGFDDADTDTIEALVRHHLLLPDVATRRDVSDPATVEFVAREAGTTERVALLRVLTEADALATGPAAWSPWKAGLVDALAARTTEFLSGTAERAEGEEAFPTPAQRDLLEREGMAIVTDGDRITVCCEDVPGVFFRVAGALALHGLDVLEANLHTEGGRALDEFRVGAGPSGVIPWDRVEADVVKVLEGRLALQARVEERARTLHRPFHAMAHQFEPAVRFDNGGSAATTVLEVVGPDSIGLLYRLARALAEFNVNVTGARIHTMAPDVVDAFYVTLYDGSRVTDPDLQGEITKALLNALDPPH